MGKCCHLGGRKGRWSMLNEGKHFTICIVGGGSRYTPGILRMMVHEMDRFPSIT